ncbi:MAG: HigA family addiction module antitoxin [Proteobacteria bacterium]|nr:HigA family addiction module antitoxin [Pseudomonadota bacterium]
MPMHSPSRPGDMVGHFIEELGDTISGAARRLGVSRSVLARLITQESAAVTPEMAVRIAAVFGSTADHWLRMQASYDASQIRKRAHLINKNLKPYPESTDTAA